MGLVPETAQLLSRLPTHLATDLFASAKPVTGIAAIASRMVCLR